MRGDEQTSCPDDGHLRYFWDESYPANAVRLIRAMGYGSHVYEVSSAEMGLIGYVFSETDALRIVDALNAQARSRSGRSQ